MTYKILCPLCLGTGCVTIDRTLCPTCEGDGKIVVPVPVRPHSEYNPATRANQKPHVKRGFETTHQAKGFPAGSRKKKS